MLGNPARWAFLAEGPPGRGVSEPVVVGGLLAVVQGGQMRLRRGEGVAQRDDRLPGRSQRLTRRGGLSSGGGAVLAPLAVSEGRIIAQRDRAGA